MSNVTVIQPTISDEKAKIRVAAYCRVSSDSADQINSFMAQVKYYEEFLSDSTTQQFVGIYADEGITGTRIDKRDEFKRLLHDCRKGKIDRIITKSISRFSRNTKDCLTSVRELKELGISVMFEKENIDTANMTDEMMITLMGGLAQEESVSISNNVRWGIHKQMQNGTFIASSVPYGYRLINKQLVIVKSEAEVVRSIFQMYLEGNGTNTISAELRSLGLIRKNSEWGKNAVRYILSNEKYIGESTFQKWYMTSTLPYRCKENKGELDKYNVTDHHEPIISKEVFQAVQKLIKKRGEVKVGNTYSQRPLSGKIYCGECGTLFKFKQRRTCGYWVCRRHDESAENCSTKQISELYIYSTFICLFNKLKQNYKQILLPLRSQLQELNLKKFSGNNNVLDIHKEIAQLKEQTHVIARLKTKGFLDDVKYYEQTNEITSKINKLQQKLRQLTQSDDEDDVIEQISLLISILEKDDNLLIEFHENIFESMVEKIIVKSQTELEFQLIGGIKFTEKL